MKNAKKLLFLCFGVIALAIAVIACDPSNQNKEQTEEVEVPETRGTPPCVWKAKLDSLRTELINDSIPETRGTPPCVWKVKVQELMKQYNIPENDPKYPTNF
jgi:hypothetical protein